MTMTTQSSTSYDYSRMAQYALAGAAIGAGIGINAYPSNMTLLNVCCDIISSSDLSMAQSRVLRLESSVSASDFNTALMVIGGVIGGISGAIYGSMKV